MARDVDFQTNQRTNRQTGSVWNEFCFHPAGPSRRGASSNQPLVNVGSCFVPSPFGLGHTVMMVPLVVLSLRHVCVYVS